MKATKSKAKITTDECGTCGRVLGGGDCYGCENDRLRAEFLAYVQRHAPIMCLWDMPQYTAGKTFMRPTTCNCAYHDAAATITRLSGGAIPGHA